MSDHDSLLAMLDVLDDALPPALVPAAARQRLRALCAALPFIACVGLECHLGEAAPRVDLLTYTANQSALHALLDGTTLRHAIAAKGNSQRLLKRWVDAILFEYDLDDSAGGRSPAVFLNFKPEAMIDGPALVQLAACLVGQLSDETAAWIRRCAVAAGRDIQVTHLGAMASRSNRLLRINVGAASAGALREFVAALGWDVKRRMAVDDLLDLVEPFAHHVVLAFDLMDEPLPRLGLECYMASTPEDGNHWQLFLAHLRDAGLCQPAEAAALLEWPGQTMPAGNHSWPSAHRHLASFLGSAYPGVIVRTLNHFKLVSAPAAPLRAKAYLLARHVWLDLTP